MIFIIIDGIVITVEFAQLKIITLGAKIVTFVLFVAADVIVQVEHIAGIPLIITIGLVITAIMVITM